MYTSLCPATYNEETLRLIYEDPECQIIISIIAFSNGINAKSILDSVSLGFSSTLDIMWQEMGRAGRAEGTLARGVVLVQKGSISAAIKRINCMHDRPVFNAAFSFVFLAFPAPPALTKSASKRKTQSRRTRRAAAPVALEKALILTETICYIACLNRHYGNPPLETSTLDCTSGKTSSDILRYFMPK
jgi:superfamily II DNA helicase RecQ